jgi:hypothetical protein
MHRYILNNQIKREDHMTDNKQYSGAGDIGAMMIDDDD